MAAGRAFADTSALLAIAHARDQYHARAVTIARRFLKDGGRFVGTPLVLGELHGLLRYRRDGASARKVIRAVMDDAAYEWIDAPAELLSAAVANWIDRFPDQPFTLADAVSFETMRRERLTTAFSFDPHFRTAGFSLLG